MSLAASALFVGAASAAPCAPVRIERADATPGKPEQQLTVRINPQIGLGLRGSFRIAGPIRGAIALDGELLPSTVGAGLSLGVEAVIR